MKFELSDKTSKFAKRTLADFSERMIVMLADMAKDIMACNGQKFDAYYSVIMPDTWTPVFDLTVMKPTSGTVRLENYNVKIVRRRGDVIR